MKTHIIKGNKQKNGLWGMPIQVSEYIIKYKITPKNEEILSAFLNVYSSIYAGNFSVEVGRSQFYIRNSYSFGKMYDYSNFEVVGNILYNIVGSDDRILFERMMKLKKIKTKI